MSVLSYSGSATSYTVPYTGVYVVTLDGAQGGANSTGTAGGKGAEVSVTLTLTGDEVLALDVGGAGGASGTSGGGGGGGGTFLLGPDGTSLAVAGGGGGAGYKAVTAVGGSDGPAGTGAPNGATYQGGAGGQNGFGGGGGTGTQAGGGGGSADGAGGGGGYSGGGAGGGVYKDGASGGGGGSFVTRTASAETITASMHSGDGSISITSVDIAGAGKTYTASGLGSAFSPAFRGGILQLDTTGATYAQQIYLDGSSTNTIDEAGRSATFTGALVDLVQGTPGRLVVSDTVGHGNLTLTGTSSFSGGIDFQSGSLELGATTSAGTGAIALATSGETLRLDFAGSNTSPTALGAAVSGFGAGDAIDLTALSSSATTSYANGILTISDGQHADTLTIDSAPAGSSYVVGDDGAGHALLKLSTGPSISGTGTSSTPGGASVQPFASAAVGGGDATRPEPSRSR